MTSGRCERLSELPAGSRAVLFGARRAIMTTLDPDGAPHSVPVIFAVQGEDVVTPIDRKPKTGRKLGRLRNLELDSRVTLLADRWSEEWGDLGWVMLRGSASSQPAESSAAELESIMARYPEHRDVVEGSDVIRMVVERISWWSWG